MNSAARLVFSTLLVFAFGGCLVSSVGGGGGIGTTTVTNSNPSAIISTATQVFAGAGYSMGPSNYPDSVSFDKPAGAYGKVMYGSYGETTSYRAKLNVVPIPGTDNYRIGVKVSRVSDAGEAGFEDSVPMMGVWSAEFAPLLRQIREMASGAGPL